MTRVPEDFHTTTPHLVVDAFPEAVKSPRSLGGTPVTLHAAE
ncbi:MAG: hypothetical protein ACREPM_11720 [Gemmatimonadaceae bacterium]